jgi:hypothetical protein
MTSASAVHFAGGGVFFLFFAAILIFYVVAYWRVYEKAGEPGWGAIVPFYNIYLLCKIAGRPGWWLILYFIPFVNLVIALVVSLDLAKAFSRSAGFGLGLWLLSFIFVPILGFGPAQYTKPVGMARF